MLLRIFGLLLVASCLASAAPAAEAITPSAFQQQLGDLAKTPGFRLGVAIKDLKSGQEFLVNPDVLFPQGSSIRIHLVSELFRQAAAGKLSVHEVRPFPDSARTGGFGVLRHLGAGTASMSLRDYAVLMIVVNDNSAANFLTDVLGMENVNASLVAQGTPEIKFQRRAISRREARADLPENVGTPRAAMRSLELIYRGEVVDRSTSNAILEVLALPETVFLHRELPPTVRFAGESGISPNMRCEEGIVLLPDRPYIFCAMYTRAENRPGTNRGRNLEDLLDKISRLALAYFSGGKFGATLGK